MTSSPTWSESSIRQAKWRLERIRQSSYIPWWPTPKQASALLAEEREELYGGAAGGGKSVALLASALEWVEVGDYAALLLRRSFADLSLPRSLIPLSQQWLGGTDARWDGNEHKWTFPSGAILQFGYMEAERDKFRYQSAAFHFVGWDELTQFTETQYRYLFSRQRRIVGSKVPVRTMAASNPGGTGHEWVHQRFLTGMPEGFERPWKAGPKRIFIPAKLEDNPHLDVDEYEDSLNELDPVTYEQLRHGRWDVRAPGGWFNRSNFRLVEDEAELPATVTGRVRFWDFAASDDAGDWTAGLKLARLANGQFAVLDLRYFRKAPPETEDRLRQAANEDGVNVSIRGEQEPGSSGKIAISHFSRNVLPGYDFIGRPATGDKKSRARPAAAAVANGNVYVLKRQWTTPFLDQCEAFPQEGMPDDLVDAFSGAFAEVAVVPEPTPAVPSFGKTRTSFLSG